jgi:alpha-beta hydrolase superfamily lysophospholipase
MSLIAAISFIFIASGLLFPVVLHWAYRAPRLIEVSNPEQHRLPFTTHYLTGKKGKKLFAWLIPAQASRISLVVVHGWGANAEMMLPLAKPFHQAGMDVLLYDARNHGLSEGDSFSSLPRFAEDLETALDWLKQRRPDHKLVVLGHSIGAAAAILSASRRHDIDLVIGMSGFAHPRLVMNRHLDRPWLPGFLRPLIMAYIQWVIGFRFDDIAPMHRIARVACPVLLAHGTHDRVVPISDMHLIQANAVPQGPVTVLPVEGAGHGSVERFQQHAESLIGFIDAHLESARNKPPPSMPLAGEAQTP